MDPTKATASETRATPRHRGFTLIELLVAVAIVAILSSIALPMFLDSIRKGRRADAFAAIAAVQQAQERWRANNPTYNTDLSFSATGLKVSEPTNYSLAIPGAAASATLANSYVVVATGRNAQASETGCKKLSLSMKDGNISYAACESCSSFSYAATNACWSR